MSPTRGAEWQVVHNHTWGSSLRAQNNSSSWGVSSVSAACTSSAASTQGIKRRAKAAFRARSTGLLSHFDRRCAFRVAAAAVGRMTGVHTSSG